MIWEVLLGLGSICAIGALIVCLTPPSFGDLEPRLVTRRRPQPVYYFELLDLIDHTAPESPLTLQQAHRESQLHAPCPPWLCPRKSAALAVLDANNRRSPSRTIL
ncbi:hypothetical protein [Nocardia sp. MW-W600-9]